MNDFYDYCWSYYGPGGIFADIFVHPVTKEEMTAAIALRKASVNDFQGDSIDREAVRDILLGARRVCYGATNDETLRVIFRGTTGHDTHIKDTGNRRFVEIKP